MEWPTVGLATAVYLAFGLATWFHEALPWWLLLPIGAYIVCLQGSLQHEAVHRHPTPWTWVNSALVFPNLWLWQPYATYRRTHLAHHEAALTEPLEDPESFYQTAECWQRRGALGQAFYWVLNSVAGRLLLGPGYCAVTYWTGELRALLRGDLRRLATEWLPNLASAVLVLGWVIGVCGMGFVEYLLLFAYPGLALTLLRSFLEHQARERDGERSVLIEAGPLFSLMFLNNNLHALHHAEPGLAWYRLPARYRARRAELLKENGNYHYSGYAEIIARFLLWPKESPLHPLSAAAPDAAGSLGAAPLRESRAFAPSKLP